MRTMGFSFSVLFLVVMAPAAAHAALSPRDYWQSVLPDTPMPAAIRDPLGPDVNIQVQGVSVDELATVQIGRPSINQKGTSTKQLAATNIDRAKATYTYMKGVDVEGPAATDISKASVSNFYQKGVDMEGLAATKVGRARLTNFYEKRVGVAGLKADIGSARVSNFDQKGVGVEGLAATDIGRKPVSNFYQKGFGVEGLANVDIGKATITNFYQKGVGVEGLSTTDDRRTRATYFYQKGVDMEGLTAADFTKATVGNFLKKKVAMKETPTTLKRTLDIADTYNFFLEKDLQPGAKMRLDFSNISPAKPFIPRGEASSIPFSFEKLSVILDNFLVKPNSVEAKIIRMTLRGCEEGKDSTEETKFCVTSLESMVDLVTSALGSHDVMAVSSEVGEEGATRAHEYTVAVAPVQRLPGDHVVSCHQQPYPYAVFYCHVTRATKVYMVPLVEVEDGARVDAVAVCHADTSAWSPDHKAFQVLKVAPGTLPICHFLPQDSVVWAPKGEASLPAVFVR